MPSNHPSLCHPHHLPPSIFPSIRGFLDELVLCIRWPQYWSFTFSISLSNDCSGLISFRIYYRLISLQSKGLSRVFSNTTVQKHYFMANRGEAMETVTDFIFLGSQITADGDCSHEIKRRLLLGRKAMTNLDSILQSRDITLPTNVHPVKAMVFPVVMYGCESWTIKKADAFEL